MENRIVNRQIGLGFFDDNFLFVRVALAPGFDRGRKHAGGLFIISEISFNFLLCTVFDPLRQNSDL